MITSLHDSYICSCYVYVWLSSACLKQVIMCFYKLCLIVLFLSVHFICLLANLNFALSIRSAIKIFFSEQGVVLLTSKSMPNSFHGSVNKCLLALQSFFCFFCSYTPIYRRREWFWFYLIFLLMFDFITDDYRIPNVSNQSQSLTLDCDQ